MLLEKMTTATTLLCAATKWEAEPVARALGLERRTDAFFGGGALGLVKTGAGAANVAKALSSLRACSVYSVGLCGALQPGMSTGDIVFDVQGAPSDWPPRARELAESLDLKIHFGRIVHSPRVLATPADKAELGARLRAGAVDMETAAIRAWAEARGADCFAIRAVLDGLNEAVPSEIPESETPAALVSYAVRHFASLPLLLATGLKSRKATSNLSRFLREFLR